METVNQELEHAPVALIESVKALKVVDVATYAQAGEFGKTIKAEIKKREDYFEPMRVKAKASYDEVLKMKKDAIDPLNAVVDVLRLNMNTYQREQEKIRQEELRKRQKEEEERAEKERQKLLAQAIKAEEKGKDEKAEELLEQAENIYVAPVTVAPTIAKTVATASGNVTQAVDYIISVTDMKAFIAALVAKNIAPTMLEVKQAPLKAWVKANGLDQFPGISINKTTSVRF